MERDKEMTKQECIDILTRLGFENAEEWIAPYRHSKPEDTLVWLISQHYCEDVKAQ